MTTLAVLLIIGSAVIGPIEAQFNDTLKPGESCVRGPGVNTCPGRSESLPELCERALKEIGASRISAPLSNDNRGWLWRPTEAPSWPSNPKPGQKMKMVESEAGTFDLVRCIPVPTVYKR